MQLNDKIIHDFKAGRLNSFYKEAYSSLLMYAVRLLGDDFSFLAEDCVQEAIFKSYQERDRISSPVQWKSFLFTLIHNDCISILRRQQSQQNYLSQLDEDIELDYTHSLIKQETLDTLYAILDSLPPRLRRIFEMSFEQGLKNTEIAEILGISPSGVKKQKSQLIDSVRDKLSDHTDVILLLLSII